ncbi:MAG: tetratricopeptide repeat protein [Capsulimonadaceae bacterium]|nr:tetratricopeptide repeat protein [Capsulimonadaceae bacterium]
MQPRRRFKGNKAAAGKAPEVLPTPPEKFRQIDKLIAAGRYDEAVDKLRKLDEIEPDSADILRRLFSSAMDLGDWSTALGAGERLVLLEPDDPDCRFSLVKIYIAQSHAMHAMQHIKTLLDRWPTEKKLGDIKGLYDAVNADFDSNRRMSSFSEQDFFEVVYQNEETQILMAQGDCVEARRVALETIDLYPTFMPARNNLAEIAIMTADYAEARRINRLALEAEPDNVHALHLAIRLARLAFESADVVKDLAARLISSGQNAERKQYKVMEGLTFAGDSQGAIDIFQQMNVRELDDDTRAVVWHYAAVAYANLGDRDRAARLWRDAHRYDPGNRLFKENLEDLKKPEGERHGAVAFEITSLLPSSVIDELARLANKHDTKDEKAPHSTAAYIKSVIDAQPIMSTVLPAILDLCDSSTISLFSELLRGTEDPRIRDYACQFVLGKRGSDKLRFTIQATLSDIGYPFDATVKVWVKGKQHEVSLMGCEINYEKMVQFPPDVDELASPAFDLLMAKKYVRAEKALRAAVARFPEYPSLWNNLAASLEAQGKRDEAMEILEQVHERFPDYLFGRTALSVRFAAQGRLDEAKALLLPIKLQGKLHITEFLAVATAQMDIISRDPEAHASDMEMWLNMVEKAAPDYARLDYYLDLYDLKLMDEAVSTRKGRRRSSRDLA